MTGYETVQCWSAVEMQKKHCPLSEVQISSLISSGDVFFGLFIASKLFFGRSSSIFLLKIWLLL